MKPWNLTLIQVYAPTNQAADGQKEGFYTCLKQVFNKAPKQDVVLLCGDYNAKIGEGASIGKFALGVRNDNGERLVEFAQVNGLVTANAMTNQHPRHKYTWRAPGRTHRNQIDYILLPQRWVSSVGKCKTCPQADADTDHTLVRMKFILKLHKLAKAKQKPCFDFSQKEEYQVELRNRFELLDIPEAADPGNRQSAESEWIKLKEVVAKSAAKTFTRKRNTVKKDWIKPETFALMEEKRNCCRQGEEYKWLKRHVRSQLRRDRDNHLTEICQQMNDFERKISTCSPKYLN